MEPLPKINLHVGDTVIMKHGRAMGLGTVVVIEPSGLVLVSWDIYGLQTLYYYSLEVVDVDKLCWSTSP